VILRETVALRDDILAHRRLFFKYNIQAVQLSVDDRPADIDKIGPEEGENVHRLGISEAGVVFDQLHPGTGAHETAVHDPFVGDARLPADRLGDLPGDGEPFGGGGGVQEGEEMVGG